MRLQENHGLQNSPPGRGGRGGGRAGKPYLATGLIFKMNKLEQMNCHVLFKQVHTMLCICTLEKMRSQICGWMDEFGVLRPFQQYFSHIGTVEGQTWKAMCNEVPSSRFGKNLSSSGIRTRDLWSEIRTVRKPNLRPTTLPWFSNHMRAYSKVVLHLKWSQHLKCSCSVSNLVLIGT